MRKRWPVLLLLALGFALAAALFRSTPSTSPTAPETPAPVAPRAVALAVSTPSTPLPPPGETVLDVSPELSPLPVRLCAGDALRFRNRHAAPVVLTASDYSFSSGVLQPGEEFSVVLSAPGAVEVQASALEGSEVTPPYPIEVVRCEGGE